MLRPNDDRRSSFTLAGRDTTSSQFDAGKALEGSCHRLGLDGYSHDRTMLHDVVVVLAASRSLLVVDARVMPLLTQMLKLSAAIAFQENAQPTSKPPTSARNISSWPGATCCRTLKPIRGPN